MNSIRCWSMSAMFVAVFCFPGSQDVAAQCDACAQPAYRVECQTVYEERQVTAYRLQEETVYEERQVTRKVPVWETQNRERRSAPCQP
jgi:hypothetical protein